MDYQFYPTPEALAARAWAKFKNRNYSRVLEPQAGNGDLANACPTQHRWGRHGCSTPIDCCEIDISKHTTLREHGFSVVGFDFLQFGSGSIYSHIIMNPPFVNGEKHVLKAWDILWNGEISAIINAETIRNPYTKDRQFLVDLIEKYGDVEFIKDAFAGPDAERQTSVEVALVYLRKQPNVSTDIIGNLMGDLKCDAETGAGLAGSFDDIQAVALPTSVIENTVVAFNAAVQSTRDAIISTARARYYAALLGDTMAVRCGKPEEAEAEKGTLATWVQGEMRSQYAVLKDRAWAGILRSTNVAGKLSSAAQKRVESEFKQISLLEFTTANIYGFLAGLSQQQGAIQQDMACDVFDLITQYHSDNTVFYKGWKSNDNHRTCGMRIKTTRFVLPRNTETYSKDITCEARRRMADFDKVFAMLDGKTEPTISLVTVFDHSLSALCHGTRISTTYFDVRYYPGAGTIHFFPKNKTLVDRLNRLVGHHRQWLPPQGARVNDAFWLQYETAEKLDKEIRTEIVKQARSRFDDPLQGLFSRDADERAKVEAKIDAAATTVLERHGILVDAQLESDGQQQLLLAA